MKKIIGYLGVGLRELFWIAVAVAVVFGGITGFRYLGENREVIEPTVVERPTTLVETAEIFLINSPLPIRGEGFMQPHRSANLASQVGGQVIELHPAITERGVFKQGEVLVRLDDSAERATLTQTQANIDGTRARLDLNQILLERTEKLRSSGSASQASLDQVRSTQQELSASLNSLIAAQNVAEVSLGRKIVTAPFDGAVLSKNLDIGSVVNGGQAIAEIFTEDRMEIDVPVREADAALIPGLFEGASPSATVSVRFAGQSFEWDAEVTRVAPTLDQRTRTLTVTVELIDITGARATGSSILASGAPPALINSFANVVIEGPQPDATYAVPSTALRGGSELWLLTPSEGDGGTLKIVPATLVHVDNETSYVTSALIPEGARLITTALSTPQEGMKLRDVAAERTTSTQAANTSDDKL
ncbi:efflux RND transporter periplasmic adaptor subunit [Ascidiaceihabitans sp.]|jgi:RND family efflux transporter MFP subunit|nr:efflux RND transporter periplasmic adaptor subunit [Paracoccaceae bacterium]MDB4212195.1 efflux RND transporter periplasmic adaptor subunit [Ascidiaceihabitans sp.]